MSKTEQKKLKGIVSISSDDFFSINTNKKTSEKQSFNNNNNQKNKTVSTKAIKKTEKKLPKPSSSSTTSSKSIQLPDNFFEQISDCEFKLKEKFDPKTFYELINLYSSAINFYERIKDPKFIIYNQSLNLLFSMPEVKKFMEGKKSLTKKEKIKDIEKRMLQSEKKITKEKVSKIYLSTIQKNTGRNIINEEFNKQSNLFKKRREEKKRKYLLSTSALIGSKKKDEDNNSNLDENNNHIKNANKSFDIISPKDDEENTNDDNDNNYDIEPKKGNPININYYGENNVLDELKKEDLKNEINKISIDGNENESDKNSLDLTLSVANSDNLLIDLSKVQRLTNKTLFQETLKTNLDCYISEFYKIFLDKMMNSIVKDYTESGNILEKKLIDSSIEYYGQRTQMQFLKDGSGNDKTYNDQLESMIQQIIVEEENSKTEIINEGVERQKILNDKYINSINNNFQSHKLEMLKEKLKLDITKAINSYILK